MRSRFKIIEVSFLLSDVAKSKIKSGIQQWWCDFVEPGNACVEHYGGDGGKERACWFSFLAAEVLLAKGLVQTSCVAWRTMVDSLYHSEGEASGWKGTLARVGDERNSAGV